MQQTMNKFMQQASGLMQTKMSKCMRLLSLLMLFLFVGIGNAWGEVTIINGNADNMIATNGTAINDATIITQGEFAYSIIQAKAVSSNDATDTPVTDQLHGGTLGGKAIIFTKATGWITNTTAFTDGITKIRVKSGSGCSINAAATFGIAISNNPITEKPTEFAATGSTAAQNTIYTFATTEGITGNPKYFAIVNTSSSNSGKAVQLSIEITYENAGGGTVDPQPQGYKVTLYAGSGTCASASLTETTVGAGVTLPVAEPSVNCQIAGWEFAGWSETSIGETTTEPTLIPAGAYTDLTEDITLYAVYKIVEAGEDADVAQSNSLSSTSTEAIVLEEGKPVTYTCGTSNGYGNPARIYKGNTLTVATNNDKMIVSIELTGASGYAISNMTVASGVLTTSGNNGVWTGSANNIVFTASTNQTRVSAMKVRYDTYTTTYASAPECAEVSVFYELNGGTKTDENKYPITANNAVLDIPTKTGFAFEGWYNDENFSGDVLDMASVEGTYYAKWGAQHVSNIAAFLENNDARTYETIIDGELTVYYAKGKYLYVKDDTGNLCIYDATANYTYANGATLTGVKGKRDTYNKLEELKPTMDLPEAGTGTEVEPILMTEAPIDADMAKYVKYEGVTLTTFDGNNATMTIENGGTITLNNYTFANEFTIDPAKVYTVEGIVGYYNSTYNVQPITITEVNIDAPANIKFMDSENEISEITLEKDEMKEITINKATSAEVIVSSSDESIAKYLNGRIYAYKEGEAILTATTQAVEGYKAGETTLTVKVVDLSNAYTLVTESNPIQDWDKLVLVSGKTGTVKAAKAYESGGNNVKSVDQQVFEKNGNSYIVNLAEGAAELSLKTAAGGDKHLFDGTYYWYAANTATGTNNYMKGTETPKTGSELDYYAVTISLDEDEGNAIIVFGGEHNDRNTIRYNGTTNQLLFSCYTGSSQNPVYLFRKAGEAEAVKIITGIAWEKDNVTVGSMGTKEHPALYIVYEDDTREPLPFNSVAVTISDEDIAAVNNYTCTGVYAGEAIVTATYIVNAISYTASYTLTVTKNNTYPYYKVQDGKTLNLNENATAVIVDANGTLNIADNVSVGYITLCINGNNRPEFQLHNHDVELTGDIYLEWELKLDKDYPFTLPCDVEWSGIEYWDGSAWDDNFAIQVAEYDGAKRATDGTTNGSNWQYVSDEEPNDKLLAHKGYIMKVAKIDNPSITTSSITVRFPLNALKNAANKLTEDAELAVSENSSANETNAGWNYVGNPFLHSYQGTYGGQNYIAVTNDGGLTFTTKLSAGQTVTPFSPFFVQVASGEALNFATAAASMLELRAAAEYNARLFAELTLDADQMGIWMSDRYTTAYEINADFGKIFGSDQATAIYTVTGGNRLAYNALPDAAAQAIPVGFSATAGEHTIALREGEGFAHLYLTDKLMNTVTDLLTADYTFTTEGDNMNESRFELNAVRAEAGTPTGVVEAISHEGIHKVLLNGKVYIVREGVWYDVMGKIVK